MKVTKANGETAAFDEKKIRRSLKRVNASELMIKRVLESVKAEMFDGIPTSKLYRIVFRELKKLQKGVAGKYNLKRAIMALGPTGFPFEEFVAAIWRAEGSSVETGVFVEGGCVKHEVDVVARRGDLLEFVECKHHSSHGQVCSVRNTLYFYARLLDLKTGELAKAASQINAWLVTNVRFTSDAISYGTCVGLGLLSWDYPVKNSLRDRIDRAGLHPITCMSSLSKQKKQKLLGEKITLCSDLCDRPQVLEKIGVRGAEAKRVIDEASMICGRF